jgi:single-stranded-DNA-specific exonuclease
MEKKWVIGQRVKKNKRIFPELEQVTEQILLNRGFKNEQQLEAFFVPDYDKDLNDPFLLNDMEKAVKRILKAIKKEEKICIFGDYDADGVTSSVLLVDFLKKEFQAKIFNYIPDREEEGYGLSKEALDIIRKKGANLIITVDCGITNNQEVDYANEKNIDVIILDHHNALNEIPKALAVIDPKNPQEKKYPFRELAGVGVAFKFLQALSEKSSKDKKEKLKWYLDLVAVGTIADCVPLLGENRILVKFGLMVLSKTKRVGFKQLFQNGKIKINENDLPTAQQVAFQIAPRLNAAGRMEKAQTAYDLLMESDQIRANKLAITIEKKNQERQKVTADILKNVKNEIKKLKKIPKVIIKFSSKWKIGIIGLSAGKLTEEYARPVILLQEKGDILRGSGRSIPGFSLVEALGTQENLLTRYGGHDQAAGLTMDKNNFDKFVTGFIKEANKKLTKKLVKTLKAEIRVKFTEINHKLCQEILMLEPFGKENELPILFLGKIKVVKKRLLGNGEKHLKLWIGENDESELLEAIAFGLGEGSGDLKIGDQIDLLFYLEKNNWNGFNGLQLRVLDYRKSE